MNGDTFGGLAAGTYRNNLNALTALGTTETVFTTVTDTGSANAFLQVPQQSNIIGSSAPLDPNANNSVQAGNLGRPGQDYRGARPYFSTNSFNGRPIVVQSSGYFTTSAAAGGTAHQFNIYQATAANGAQLTTKNTVFSSLSSTSLAAGSYNYLIQVTLIWDAVSQQVTGYAEGIVGGTYTGRTAITPISVTSAANLFFFPSVKFASGATNTVNPIEFNLSQV